MFLMSLILLWRATALPTSEFDLLLLGWAASSTLLSFSVTGFPYISNTLPFAIALWLVLGKRSWPTAAIFAALAIETSWHVQELGRTVFVVFLAAAAFLPAIRWSTRAVYVCAGVLQAGLAHTFHSFNTSRYASMPIPGVPEGIHALLRLGSHVLHERPDLLAIVPLAMVTVVFTGKHRAFWGVLIGVQGALLWWLAANAGTLQGVTSVWPRRMVLFSFLGLGGVLAACHATPSLVPWVRASLLAGAVLQVADTVTWAGKPLDQSDKEAGYTLPYTHTELPSGRYLDYKVPFFMVRWYLEMREQVDRGERLLLLYNLSSFDENLTDPAGILERLYLHLGHNRFVEQVLVFGDASGHWGAVPVRPMGRFQRFMDELREPGSIRGYELRHLNDFHRGWEGAAKHRAEMGSMVSTMRRKFRVVYGRETTSPYGARHLVRFTLEARPEPGWRLE
jgi:hypothetical protein